jgi:hypothetical protein
MALLVIAYPELSSEDFQKIQDFRRSFDLYYSIVKPHVTFIFPTYTFNKDDFINEVISKSKDTFSIHFEIKCATVNKDSFSDYFHLLLVPDKGYSDIVKLHDKLYCDIFFKELRLDIDFKPHIGIANSYDKLMVKKWADEWNDKDFEINGRINTLTIVDFSNNVVTNLFDIKLRS